MPSSRAVAAVHRDRGDSGDAAVGDQRHCPATTVTSRQAGRHSSSQQPLTGLGGGETIREVHQDTPFSMVALTAEDLTGTSARVRAKKSDGSWGPWYEAETLDGVGDPTPRLRAAPSPSSSAAPPRCRSRSPARPGTAPTGAAPKAPAKPGLGYVPANVEQPFAQNINAVLISPPQAPVDTLPLPSAVTVPGQPPNIISRAQWGADEAMRCGNTVYDNGIRAARRPPHRGQQRLHTPGFGRHRPVDLRVPHPHAGLVRHRLQRAGRQVRPGLRGPRRRHGQTGRGCRTPAASTATPGAWRCSATSTSCRRHRSSCGPSAG